MTLSLNLCLSLLIVFVLIVSLVYLHVSGKFTQTYLWYKDRRYYKKLHKKYGK